MEIILEQDEIEQLLREGMKQLRGVDLGSFPQMKIRRNNKLQTMRVIFTTTEAPPGAISHRVEDQ